MKGLITVLVLLGMACIPSLGQSDTLYVSDRETVHLRFKVDVRYVDLGDEVLLGKIVQGNRDVALKAREPFDYPTTVSCLGSDGGMVTYVVRYSPTPRSLLVWVDGRQGSPSSPSMEESPQWERVSSGSVEERILSRRRRLFHIGDWRYGIGVFCQDIVVHADRIYIPIRIENNSLVSYNLSPLRFSVERRRGLSRREVYERTLSPLGCYTRGSSGREVFLLFSFRKFSLTKGQALRAYIYEKGGERNYVLEFTRRDIENASRLDDLRK